MESTGVLPRGRLTLIALAPDTPLPSMAVALIVTAVSPLSDTALTNPVESTAATAGLLEDHVTALFVALSGKTTALNCTVEFDSEPISRAAVEGLTVMDATGTAGAVTVTVQLSLILLPSVA
jgi:hypothetical protein